MGKGGCCECLHELGGDFMQANEVNWCLIQDPEDSGLKNVRIMLFKPDNGELIGFVA